ncbi:MAG: DUF4055 domain-containing protein [Moraxellaceae bacterium]
MSNPGTAADAVTAMHADWNLVEALMGGTKAMRAAGKAYLPMWPGEEQKAYDARLSVSTLLPAYRETITNMTSRVFAGPVQLLEDVPGNIAELMTNVDREGNNLQVWARDWFSKGLAYGIGFALVDYPRADGIRTVADEKRAGVRPYAIVIHPKRVLGWKSQGGVLTQFRFSEVATEDDGAFASKSVEQVRVLEIGKWSIYRKNDKAEWVLYDEGVSTLPVIPVVPFYTGRTGYMTATPVLMDLAHLNVKHWQSQSDQDNILHVARVPIFTVIGYEDVLDENGKPSEIKVGSGTALKLPLNGDAKWVEHTGAAIDAGRDSLKDLLEDMRMAGAKLLQPMAGTAAKTAEQVGNEADIELSPLETMALSFQDAINQMLQLFAMWTGQADGGSCKVQGNFEIDYAPETSLTFLMSMANAGKLSDETLFAEAKRRGVVSDEADWETERERLDRQGPALGSA